MKIAVASEDGVAISSHFGRSACFIVYNVEGSQIAGKEIRDNTYTAHAQGECDGEHHDHSHSHQSIVDALHDCDAVLCYGMGWRAAEELAANGIKPVILGQECAPDEAASLFLDGKLDGNQGQFCRCHE